MVLDILVGMLDDMIDVNIDEESFEDGEGVVLVE